VDKKTVAIIVLSSLLVISIGYHIYQEIRLAKTPDLVSKLRGENEELTRRIDKSIEIIGELNESDKKDGETIAELRGANMELREAIRGQEDINLRLRIRVDRLTKNYEESIPVYNEIRGIFEKYAEED